MRKSLSNNSEQDTFIYENRYVRDTFWGEMQGCFNVHYSTSVLYSFKSTCSKTEKRLHIFVRGDY